MMNITTPLKLWVPSGSVEPRTDETTLDRVFHEQVRPRLESRKRAAATIEDYERALKAWNQFWGTEPPALADIDIDHLDRFSEHLIAQGKGGRTVNKICGNLQLILDLCGPKRNKPGRLGRPLGLLDDVPHFVRQEETRGAAKRELTLDQVEAMLANCHVAQNPQRQPARKWSAAIRLVFWCGPRRDDLFMNLRLSNWIRRPECPIPTVSESWPWGGLSWVPAKTARIKPEPLVVPIPKELAHDLAAIERPRNESDPPLLGFSRCNVVWRREFSRIQLAAGIAQPITFQEARRTANIHWQRLISEGTGAHFLGHSPRGVNAQHYSDSVVLMVKAARDREKLQETEGTNDG